MGVGQPTPHFFGIFTPYYICRDGEIGRRAAFRTQFSQEVESSNLSRGTGKFYFGARTVPQYHPTSAELRGRPHTSSLRGRQDRIP